MNIKNIYTKWIEVEKKKNEDNNGVIFEYYISKTNKNNLYFGINVNDVKTLYIEFDKNVLKDYELPKITGMKIYILRVPQIDQNKEYISITNDTNSEEVFLAFISTFTNKLSNSNSNYKTISALESTIKFYKNYFSNLNFVLSESEEQGLCAELDYLYKLILKNGEDVVINWLGPEKNKRDFVFENKAIEIKSSLNQTNPIITVSNENQLYKKNLDELKLVVYILEKNQLGKIDVISCATRILDLISNVKNKKIFISKLIILGINIDIYKVKTNYSIQSIKSYLIDDNFPSITKKDIPENVFDVKYKLNLNNLNKFCIKESEE